MNKEEAIQYLSPIAESASLERYKEALSLAIAALRDQQEVGETQRDSLQTLKVKALLTAIGTGLVKGGPFGCNINAFLRFWERFSEMLPNSCGTGDTMNHMAEKEKTEFAETVDILKSLSRDDLMKTWGFALGLKVKEESKKSA